MSAQQEKPKNWKEAHVPSWLKWAAAAYLFIGAVFMLWSATQPIEISLTVDFIYLAGFVAIVLMAYIHGVLQLRREKTPLRPITPKGFLKQCIKCGKEIPIASEVCAYCGAKQ